MAEINLSALERGEELVDEVLRETAELDAKQPDLVPETAELLGLRGRISKQ